MNDIQLKADELSAKTIHEGLRSYTIGEKLRRLRLKKSMGLVELGRHTGLSPAMLSKLENSHVMPTLPTLLRISMVFSVGLDYFFTSDQHKRIGVARKGERMDFEEMMGADEAVFRFQSLDYPAVERRSNGYFAVFESRPPEDVPLHEHSGSEFLYILGGTLGLRYDGQEIVLDEGDSVYFDSAFPHGYRRIGSNRCEAVVVTVPT